MQLFSGGIAVYTFSVSWLKSHNAAVVPSNEVWIDIGRSLLLLQIAAVLILFFSSQSFPALSDDKEFAKAKYSSVQFFRLWRGLLISWVLLYAGWCYSWPDIVRHSEGKLTHIYLDFFNLLSSAFILLCYLVMVQKTSRDDRTSWHKSVFNVFAAFFIIIAIGVIVTNMTKLPEAFVDGFEGLLSGVALALLVGRFESRLIGTRRWIVAALYGYAVIQFAYPLLGTNDPRSQTQTQTFLLITSIALILKVLLVWIVSDLIKSGLLTYYMYVPTIVR